MTDISKYNRQDLIDKIDGLESDLEYAVEVAYKHGAHDFVRLNYPAQYKDLSAPKKVVDVWDETRCAAPDATGDMSSEEFIRSERDKW